MQSIHLGHLHLRHKQEAHEVLQQDPVAGMLRDQCLQLGLVGRLQLGLPGRDGRGVRAEAHGGDLGGAQEAKRIRSARIGRTCCRCSTSITCSSRPSTGARTVPTCSTRG